MNIKEIQQFHYQVLLDWKSQPDENIKNELGVLADFIEKYYLKQGK